MAEVAPKRRYVVIMAGGVGTRFWPWSRQERPKQLLKLCGDTTMLADTVARVSRLVPTENILIVTGTALRKGVLEAVPELPAANVYCEPLGRNTAACVGWAAMEVAHRDPTGVMVVLPADHVVDGRSSFESDVRKALRLAEAPGVLVTFGIKPDSPSTGYGYIRAGAEWKEGRGARKVLSFHEKPSLSRAKSFIRRGNFYWNSGMFVWRADSILAELRSHLPRLAAGLEAMEAKRRRGRVPRAAIDSVYPRLQSISIDHGVMEKAKRVAVVPASFGWSDIGTWDAVGEVWPKDRTGNASHGVVISVDSSGNLAATEGKPVAFVGVEGLAVVDSGDALLVCSRERSQDVREVVEELKKRGLTGLL